MIESRRRLDHSAGSEPLSGPRLNCTVCSFEFNITNREAEAEEAADVPAEVRRRLLRFVGLRVLLLLATTIALGFVEGYVC